MIECPSPVFTDEKPVLIFYPQGLDKTIVKHENIYPNMALVGDKLDSTSAQFDSKHSIQNLDDGFGVYAAQSPNAPDGKIYALGWVSLPDLAYPTDIENWSGRYSQVKELSLKDGQLIQKPVSTIKNLRQEEVNLIGELDIKDQYEFKLEVVVSQKTTSYVAANETNTESLKLHIDTVNGESILDRQNNGFTVNEKYGIERAIKLPQNITLDLDIFVDHSSIEVFVNNGEHVLTVCSLPKKGSNKLLLGENIKFKGQYREMADI